MHAAECLANRGTMNGAMYAHSRGTSPIFTDGSLV